jgi:hypothetical protein
MKMRLRSIIVGCLLALLPRGPALGQALYVAPTQTEFDQIDLLTGAKRSGRLSVEARTLYHFDTNVEDFARRDLRFAQGRRVWALLCPSPFQWQLGYEQGGLRLQLGLSSIDLGASSRATFRVGYRLFL